MKLSREQKGAFVATLTDELRAHPNVYLTDFTGLAVKDITELRRRLRAAGVKYVVVKNTLAQRALEQAELPAFGDPLAGPTAFALAHQPVEAAKILADFERQFGSFQIKAALVERRPADAALVRRLATLPSRPELLAQLAGGFQAPLQAFVGVLNGLLYEWVGALEALRAQRADAA